jgi:hypothetical protein
MTKLKILPGLKWKGSIKILSSDQDSYVVQFDAEDTDPRVEFKFIYDRTTLTARQLEDWTGYRADENRVDLTTKRMSKTTSHRGRGGV